MGGKTNTTTQQSSSSYAPSSAAQQSLQSILGLASNAASTPYQAYTGQLVSPLSSTQQSGIANTNAAVGTAQPYINQAANYATSGAAPITANQISSYLNPFQQNVINSTMANINETNGQQQQQVLGNAALQGALGGDRVGVAQSELARQQGLASGATLAGLQSQNYNQALSAAQADRAAQSQAAYTYGNLGGEAQNAALQGAQAQIGAGGLEQQTSQAGLNAAYQQYQQQLAYPYQQAQFLAGIDIPAAGALGGTTQGTATTTSPGPNLLSQIAGLGIAGAGLLSGYPGAAAGLGSLFGGSTGSTGYSSTPVAGNYFPQNPYAAGSYPAYQPGYGYYPSYSKDGGRIGYADGGATNFMDTQGFIPRVQIGNVQQHKPTASFLPPAQQQASPYSDLIRQLSGLKGKSFEDGGFVSAVRSIRSGLKGYAPGGTVADDFSQLTAPSFDNRWQEVQDASDMFNRPASVSSPLPVIDADAAGLGKPVDWTNPALQSDAGFPPQAPSEPPPAPQSDYPLPPEITGGQSASPFPMAYVGGSGSGFAPPSPDGTSSPQEQTLFGAPLTDTRRALIAAGLGIMGGTSPFALTNIGQGALQGVKSLDTSRTQAQKDRQVNIEAKRLAQQADQFTKNYGLKEQQENVREQQANRPAFHVVQGMYGQKLIKINPLTGETTVINSDGTVGDQPPKPQQPNYVIPGPNATDTSAPPSADKTAAAAPAEDTGLPANAIFVSNPPPSWVHPEVLEGMTTADANRVKAMSDGREKFLPQGRNNPHNMYLMDKLHEYDSNIDESAYGRRQKTANFFAVGTQGGGGQNIAAMNTWAQHMDEYLRLSQELHLGQYKSLNEVYNFLTSQGLTSKQAQDKLGQLEVASKAVADEGAKVFAGSGSALADREAWGKIFGLNTPSSVSLSKGKEVEKLVEGRLNALSNQYNEGMRTSHDPQQFIAPKTREIMDRLKQSGDSYAPSGGGATIVHSKSEYDALPSGSTFTSSDGKPYRKP
jgi:hypothetical protein